MKNIIIVLTFIICLLIVPANINADSGDVEGQIYSTDILAYVNNKPIESYNIDGKTVIIVETLFQSGYNFGGDYYDDDRLLVVKPFFRMHYGEVETVERGTTGKIIGDIYKTDIKVLFNEIEVKKPWAVRVSKMVNGVQKFRYIDYCETKTDALKRLAQEQITPTSPKANITFKELYEEWITTPAFTGISKQTQTNYTSSYIHLSKLHNKKFNDIRTVNIQGIIDDLDRSKSTKQKIKLLCGLLYKYAMQNDICNKNYAEFVKIGKEVKKGKEIFSDIEIKKLEDNLHIPYVDTIIILIYTGLRISELLQMTRFGVDLKNMTLTGGLKTDAGTDRTVPIHPKALPHIKRYYDQGHNLLITKSKEVGRKGEKELIEGLPITPNYYRKFIYYPILEQLGIEKKTPHTTRHTCATLMARSGVDTNAIKLILGHTDYAFTADTYTHTDIDFLKSEFAKV